MSQSWVVRTWLPGAETKTPPADARGFLRCEGGEDSVFCRPGGDRLSRVLTRSTIGAGGFNGRVRNGIGWNSPAKTTRPAKNGFEYLGANASRHAPGFITRHGTSMHERSSRSSD